MRLISPNFALSLTALLVALVGLSRSSSAGWFDPAWKFRRQIDAAWDADKAQGGELATAEFYTGGHVKPNGADLRVATEEGRPVPAHVLRVGPGDKASVAFELAKHVTRYFVYFGNDAPTPLRPELADVKIQSGLLLQTKQLPPGLRIESPESLAEAWTKADKPLGQMMLEKPFLGINPFGPEEQTISKVAGSLIAGTDGDYTFSMAVHTRAALFIDTKPVLFAREGPSDATFHVKVPLTHGRHDFVLYHACTGGWGRFVVAWILPGHFAYEPIPAAAFGLVSRSKVGPLEEIRKEFVADYSVQYGGECFYADHYSHRYKFAAREALKNARLQLRWDFGDGQTSTDPEPEHVFLADGIYPVTLTMQIGPNSSSITNRLAVSRDWERIDNPPGDTLSRQSAIVQRYDLARMPEEWLPWAVLLHQRAERLDPMLAAMDRMISLRTHPDPGRCFIAMRDASDAAVEAGKAISVCNILEKAPAGSDLQPQAVERLARLLLWRVGDFQRAVQALQPMAAKGDDELKRIYGQALVLSGKADEGRKVLAAIPPAGKRDRQAAVSGAEARTIEFYMTQKEADAGETAWERWQQLYPTDFLEGYGVLLQTRLMELSNASPAAAKVAEAFANVVPGSPYAPQLLERASKLLAKSDPAKSAALHKQLQDRYPEDPLSQD